MSISPNRRMVILHLSVLDWNLIYFDSVSSFSSDPVSMTQSNLHGLEKLSSDTMEQCYNLIFKICSFILLHLDCDPSHLWKNDTEVKSRILWSHKSLVKKVVLHNYIDRCNYLICCLVYWNSCEKKLQKSFSALHSVRVNVNVHYHY